MTGIVWLASYPKSGNTWFRIIVANLAAERPVEINDLPAGGGIASGRRMFEAVTLLDSGLLTHDEADSLRPGVYAAADAAEGGESNQAPQFIKAHDAYVATRTGEPLFGGVGRAILIVRDPRDVASSLANHRHSSVDQAIALMNRPDAALAGGRRAQHDQFRQRLLDWSAHVASWLEQTDIPVHLLRYEDLAADPVGAVRAALGFAGIEATLADLRRAIEFASFEQLRAQELARGFKEWPPNRRRGKSQFFRRGEAGGWRDELSTRQAQRIEAVHGRMMRRLGYELAVTDAGGPGPDGSAG